MGRRSSRAGVVEAVMPECPFPGCTHVDLVECLDEYCSGDDCDLECRLMAAARDRIKELQDEVFELKVRSILVSNPGIDETRVRATLRQNLMWKGITESSMARVTAHKET